MSDIIRQLPDSVANQIAAGEVIQRPASVVKELVENSVDAGATEIQIVIKDAGRTLIQVIDNGKGMSPTDARLAFERHATSKITRADDLFSLHTMGFRGEALPSICAISSVELRTMAHDADLGTCVVITASKKESQQPAVCAPGCNIMVRNLFFNVPARRKFLRSDSVELANIMREFERLALVNFSIRMGIDTGSRQISLRAGSFKQRIADIWKNNLNMQLLPLDVDTSVVKINGFISRPEYARRRNALQFLIVNGRNMSHPYFRKAIESAYEGMIAADTKPCFFIRFEVDPATIDVNIHPTKHEIKFENEQTIWPILQAAVKGALGRFSAGPSIDFSTDALPLDPARPGDFVPAPDQGVDNGYNPFRQSSAHFNPFDEAPAPRASSPRPFAPADTGFRSPLHHSSRIDPGWDRLYSDFMNAAAPATPEQATATDAAPDAAASVSSVQPCIQCAGKYIVTTTGEGLMIVDRHRAHIKILYERYLKAARAGRGKPATQRVMFAEPLLLDAAQETVLESILPEVRSLGFVLGRQAPGRWEIEGVPALPADRPAAEVITGIIASASDDTADYGTDATPGADPDAMLKRVALAAARSAAITSGQPLSPAEAEHLLGELLSLPDPIFTPSGNPVLRNLTHAELARLLQ